MSATNKFQILSLSGGGYRGLHVARILEIIEEKTGHPIAKHFDLIAGTSIGGIIGLALALEIPATKIREALENTGRTLFPNPPPTFNKAREMLARPRIWSALWYAIRNRNELTAEFNSAKKAWYNPKPLADAISAPDFFGDKKISELLHPIIVPAVNYSSGLPTFFKSDHYPGFEFDRELYIRDVALGTSAAPVYFPAHKVGDSRIVDGGLIANDPTHVAVHEALKFFGVRPALFGDDALGMDDLRVLSIGTLTKKHFADAQHPLDIGLLEWGMSAFDLSASAQEAMSAFMIDEHMLPNRVFRLPSIAARPESAPGMADATPVSAELLRSSAARLTQAAFGNPVFLDFFQHQAKSLPDVRNILKRKMP